MSEIIDRIKGVRTAAKALSLLSDDERNDLLKRMAEALAASASSIAAVNELDLAAARKEGYKDSLIHRLELPPRKLAGAIESVKAVRELPSPLGRVKVRRELDDGLILEQVSFPLGVIGMIFEARPDALIQIVSLAIKSGNGIVLKGGKEAVNTNRELARVIAEGLDGAPWMLLLESHADVAEMLKAEGDIDLLIPRGSNSFVRYVMENSNIPVMGHADGICALYVDKSADLEKAVTVAVDSKVQYPSACNAVETILVHESVAPVFLPAFRKALDEYGVIIHGDEETAKYIPVIAATEEDYHTEYLALELNIKVVSSIDEAIAHIASHGSHHTDAIISEDAEAVRRFQLEVDSADVFANCSTRFADGFRFGLGAEVGISTSKLHARGPVGPDGLTTTKWLLKGNGDTVAPYAKGEKHFTHKDLT